MGVTYIKDLDVYCAADIVVAGGGPSGVSAAVTAASGAVDFKDTVYSEDVSVVYYSDFGAKGDGVADDLRTDGLGVSDGGYYDEVENNGGFFGDTKFITEENTYLGTDHTNTETFSFE